MFVKGQACVIRARIEDENSTSVADRIRRIQVIQGMRKRKVTKPAPISMSVATASSSSSSSAPFDLPAASRDLDNDPTVVMSGIDPPRPLQSHRCSLMTPPPSAILKLLLPLPTQRQLFPMPGKEFIRERIPKLSRGRTSKRMTLVRGMYPLMAGTTKMVLMSPSQVRESKPPIWKLKQKFKEKLERGLPEGKALWQEWIKRVSMMRLLAKFPLTSLTLVFPRETLLLMVSHGVDWW